MKNLNSSIYVGYNIPIIDFLTSMDDDNYKIFYELLKKSFIYENNSFFVNKNHYHTVNKQFLIVISLLISGKHYKSFDDLHNFLYNILFNDYKKIILNMDYLNNKLDKNSNNNLNDNLINNLNNYLPDDPDDYPDDCPDNYPDDCRDNYPDNDNYPDEYMLATKNLMIPFNSIMNLNKYDICSFDEIDELEEIEKGCVCETLSTCMDIPDFTSIKNQAYDFAKKIKLKNYKIVLILKMEEK